MVTVAVYGSSPLPTVANYLIVATRATGAVSAQRQTLGQLKARFRDPVPTTR